MKLISTAGICLSIFICSATLSRSASASYESPYESSAALVQSPYIAQGVVSGSGGQGWNSGQSAGSYYHYHVPVVGQQPHYHPQPQSTSPDIHHQLLWIIPLLLLLIAPALLLPLLLKFLLLPMGLSLIGLLLPLLMMGMMMMMMMMMGGDMMMPMRNRQPMTSVTSVRSLGTMLLNDWTSIFSLAARSLDADNCPEMLVCQLGGFLYPHNSSSAETSRNQQVMSNYIVEQLIPRGRMRKLIRTYKDAFWTGSKSNDCSSFTCQPKIRLFSERNETDTVEAGSEPQLESVERRSNFKSKSQQRHHHVAPKDRQNYVQYSSSPTVLFSTNSSGQKHENTGNVEEILGEP